MNYAPIINSKLKLFKKNYGLENLEDNTAFEFFINNLVLRMYQPEAFSVVNDLFDQVCVGGQEDTGIDGIAIKINGVFISTKEDVDGIIKNNPRIKIEFIFIQAKNKTNLDSGEFGKFMSGVTDFLSEQHCEPHNEKIGSWIALKDYLCSEEILVHWETSPNIKLFYAYMGEWQNDVHTIAKYDRTKITIDDLGLYGDVSIKYLDSAGIKKVCDDAENQFHKAITIIDSMELNEAPDVKSSRVLLCSASDFVSLLLGEDGELRRTLFKDNVRDYQGATDINEEILNTLRSDPHNFCLLNNGITIVCKSMMPGNRKISIENPQIVNGCQTCNTIYRAYKEGLDLSKVSVVVKLIATDSSNVTNAIVKGTNRQNIVYDEAFEITRQFHKDLEEFVEVIQNDIPANQKVYYERRSNQFANVPTITINQKANFKILIQSFVSTILQLPHDGFVHDSYLLSKYRNQIFIDGQSFYPYFLSVYLNLKLDSVFKSQYEEYKHITTYKYQIMCLLVEQIAGIVPDINNAKRIDAFCEKVYQEIKDTSKLVQHINTSISLFNTIKEKWIREKGTKYRYAIKDNADFTKYMLTYIRGGNTDKVLSSISETNLRGTVVTVKKDRNGLYYGYIKHSPSDVFIHEDDNPSIRFYDLVGKDVVYQITTSSLKTNTSRAKIKYVVRDGE